MLLSKRRLACRLSFTLLILVAALALGGCSLGIFDRVIPREPIRVINESGTAFSVLGLYWEDHLLLHKAEGGDVYQAVFPGKLLAEVPSARMVGITRDLKVYVSGPVDIKGKDQLMIQSVQPLSGDIPLLSGIPALDSWETARSGGKVSASFKADTPFHYQVYVLGRGTTLAPSGWDTRNAPVTVSWEENRGMTQSWLLLKAE